MVLRLRALPFALTLLLPLRAGGDELEGVVRMSRSDYDRLKDAADRASESPGKQPVTVPPSVENAVYELRVSPERIALELTADVVVRSSAQPSRVSLPPAGLLDSLAETGPATVGVVREGGRLDLVFPRPGRYRIGARFLPAESRSEGQRSVDFAVLPAAASRLAGFGSDSLFVSVSGAPPEPLSAGASRPLPASASVRAVVKASARLAPAEKPLVLCDTVDVLRVERDRVTQRVFVRLAITRGPIAGVALRVGAGAEVASLAGPSDATHSVGEEGRLDVSFSKPISGDHVLSVFLTRPAPGEGGRVEVEPTRVDGAASSRAYVLVDPNPLRNQETIGDGTTALSRVDAEDLPAVALAFASAGTRAYRVTGPGAKLALAAPERAVLAPPDMLLRVADLLTVFGDGGARVDRRTFSFETRLPHLDLPLPAGEEVLAVAVDGVPAVPRVDGASLVVSLPPSANSRRTVTLTTKAAAAVPARRGELTVAQPALPAAALLAKWTIVVPEDRLYRVERTAGISDVAWTRDAPVVVARPQAQVQGWTAAQNVFQTVPAPAPAPSPSSRSVALDLRATDPEGLALPGVSIRMEGPGGTKTFVTDATGRAGAGDVAPGRYEVSAQLPGFNTVRRSETLAAGSTVSLPFVMEMSSVAAEATVVSAETIAVESGTTTAPSMAAREKQRGRLLGPDLSGLRKKGERTGSVEGDVEGGVEGGVTGGVVGSASVEDPMRVTGDLSEKLQAGGRSLDIEVTGHGKRLVLSGPLVGGEPFSVTLSVKPD